MGGIFTIQVGDELTGRCWDCCGTQAAYMCQLEANLKKLQDNIRKLEAVKVDLEQKVLAEEGKGMKRLAQVDSWFSRVDSALASAGGLITDRDRQIHTLCLGGCCSKNCWSSYTFGRKVVENYQTLVSLEVEGKEFKEVAVVVPEEDAMPEMSGDPTVGLERKLDEVWSCLSEEHVGMVGLYGIGGVGKTTLLNKIHDKFIVTSKDFLMIWVKVSQNSTLEDNSTLENIQKDIGKKIGLYDEHWNDKHVSERAVGVRSKLLKKKFVLLLDDIQKPVNLTLIGVPHQTKLNHSKVIFTTRSKNVCDKMGARAIEVQMLEWDQAWELFEMYLGKKTSDIHRVIRPLAESVAKKCGGLPLALITIGRAMSGEKAEEEWLHAEKTLKTPSRNMEGEVLSKLRFSFDSLENDTIRSCFLYCALFPYDYEISKDRLVDLWICEDFWPNCDEAIHARHEGYSIIGTLVGACLLQDRSKYVKLHNMIREMAIWIMKENALVDAGTELQKAPKVERWERVTRVSLMQSSIGELTEVPTCDDLVSLLLHDNVELSAMSDDFFQFMGSLTVLDVSRSALSKLPPSISRLVSLQYLNIERTGIQELPIELTALTKLKYLNVSWLELKAKKSERLMSNLSSLQVLRMLGCCYSYEEGDEEAYEGTLLQELQCLKHLNALAITIRCVSTLDKFANEDNLWTNTKQLCLRGLEGLKQLNISLLANIKHVNWLQIEEYDSEEMHIDGSDEGTSALGGIYNSNISEDRRFNSLREVSLRCCYHLRELTWLILLSNLAHLYVGVCKEMEEIISDEKLGEVAGMPHDIPPFSALVTLVLEDLPRLKCICQKPLAFPFLKEVRVTGCPELKKLPLDRNSGKGCKIELTADKEWWEAIDWGDPATKAVLLPRFNCTLLVKG